MEGILVIALIDTFIPKDTNPHEVRDVEELNQISSKILNSQRAKVRLMRTGILQH
ncbi:MULTISPECIES: hypothetical protein [Paraclostridium]|uniref:hypothetical protein n=1 Tax=Paraclostridium TaxID=1849822 RepID=UPI000AC56E1A